MGSTELNLMPMNLWVLERLLDLYDLKVLG